jgi:hypothetical protein
MNRMTSMNTQSFSRSRSREPGKKLAEIAPLVSLNSGSIACKALFKSPASDPSLRSQVRAEKTIHNITATAAMDSLSTEQRFLMRITIDASSVTQLRHLAIGTCGDLLVSMRVQPLERAAKMKVCLCLSMPAVDIIMDAVMRTMPSAEFGRVTSA